MDFDCTEQQTMLRSVARDFLAKECPKSRTRELEREGSGYDPVAWAHMAELGWLGLALPEEYGGSGAGLMDLVVLMEEMGSNILPAPFFSTIAMGALPIAEYGDEGLKARYLPSIARGDSIWTMAVNEECGDADYKGSKTMACAHSGGYVLNGEKIFVQYANVADHMLVAARIKKDRVPDKVPSLFIVDSRQPGVSVENIPTMTGEVQCRVTFRGVRLSGADILGKPGDAGDMFTRVLDKASLLKCAEVSGACQSVLQMTNSYAIDRLQFGRPIGAFQAIQHRLVDMLTDVEGLQYLVWQAAWLMSTGADYCDRLAMAKVKANDVYQRVALNGVKIHGAIGFSQEHDIGLYYRRVIASKSFPRGTDYYLEKVAQGIGL